MNNLVDVLLTVCALGVLFLLFFLYALLRDMSRITGHAQGSAAYKDERLDSPAWIREKREPRRAEVDGANSFNQFIPNPPRRRISAVEPRLGARS